MPDTVRSWQDGRILRLQVERAGQPLDHGAVLEGLARDPELRSSLDRAIADAPFPALFFECRPTSGPTLEQPWQAVLLDSPALARVAPDPGPFARPLAGLRAPAVTAFPSLGHDALLVVPASPGGAPASHTHLAAFCRGADPAQRDALWALLGRTALRRLASDPSPLWISTSGLGVSWLHLRLDTRPKYYTHREFRAVPGW